MMKSTDNQNLNYRVVQAVLDAKMIIEDAQQIRSDAVSVRQNLLATTQQTTHCMILTFQQARHYMNRMNTSRNR